MNSSESTIPQDAVWFVTGCSSGIGAAICKYALSQGRRVVATARNPATLDYLRDSDSVLKLSLDVTSNSSIDAALKAALGRFGRIDVLVNNAGLGMMGVTEALEEKPMRDLMEINFWGPVMLTKAAVAIFRDTNRKSGGVGGIVVQVSSMGGRVAYPGNALYHASKFALEGFTESIAQEMHPDWNIKFMILEPGGTKTAYTTTSGMYGPTHPAYSDPEMPINQLIKYVNDPKSADSFADPLSVAKTVFETVGRQDMPLRLVTGSDTWKVIKAREDAKSQELEKWKKVSAECGASPVGLSLKYGD